MSCFRSMFACCIPPFCRAEKQEREFENVALTDKIYFFIPEDKQRDFVDYGPENTYLNIREYLYLSKYETPWMLDNPGKGFEMKEFHFNQALLRGWVPTGFRWPGKQIEQKGDKYIVEDSLLTTTDPMTTHGPSPNSERLRDLDSPFVSLTEVAALDGKEDELEDRIRVSTCTIRTTASASFIDVSM